MKRFVLALLIALPAAAQPYRWDAPKTTERVWWASQAALLGATAADMATSYHNRYELNPLLRSADGRFGNRGILIKTGITGAWLSAQWLIIRRSRGEHDKRALLWTFSAANGAISGMMGATAARNVRGPTR
jgi:hypothetical protein